MAPESPRPHQHTLQGRHGANRALSLASACADSDRASRERALASKIAEIRQDHPDVSRLLERLRING